MSDFNNVGCASDRLAHGLSDGGCVVGLLEQLAVAGGDVRAGEVGFDAIGSAVDRPTGTVYVVGGQIVVEDRRLTTIDEVALRQAVEEVMPGVRADLDVVSSRIDEIAPYLLDAWRRSWGEDIGLDRYVGGRG